MNYLVKAIMRHSVSDIIDTPQTGTGARC